MIEKYYIGVFLGDMQSLIVRVPVYNDDFGSDFLGNKVLETSLDHLLFIPSTHYHRNLVYVLAFTPFHRKFTLLDRVSLL
ncbi:MAG: hypothetical protein LUO93_08775 [Methanomicrobiales archaeon]|nr:hypothetical protein [Methanomicrobiales archaeon]